ncbi:hypothetical protein [Streptomyces sp. NPDC058424]|uniref:hypothetical protein n=1 Tax=Streptomyces sp. NPDC058424 TaxID=3346491 RepID=UPI00366003B3
MSSSFCPNRSRRIAAAASVLTMVAVAAGVLFLALGVSLPEAWWPHTGHAFAADQPSGPCERIAGPANAYCERGRSTPGTTFAQGSGEAAAWKLVPAATAVGALVIWRRRTPGQGRR